VKNMVATLLSLSVSFAAQLLSGSAGVTPISVNRATKSKLLEIMFRGKQRKSCRSARLLLTVL